MIRTIDAYNQLRYRDTLESQFRFRHEIFVREQGWTDFERDGQYETDQYDNEKTIYQVALDDAGTVVGCFRLYPTTVPHMLGEVFPYLVDGPLIERPDVMELSRMAVSRDRRHGGTYYELMTALQEYGLGLGLSAVVAIMRSFRIPVVQMAGFKVTPLGLPKEVDGETLVAVKFDIDEETLERIRITAKVTGSVLEDDRVREQVAKRSA